MLLSFQRPPRPVGKGTPSQETRPERTQRPGATADYSAPPAIPPRGLDGRAPPRQPRDCSASGQDLHRDDPLARAVVEVQEHELLPGAQAELAADHRDRLAGPAGGGARGGGGVVVWGVSGGWGRGGGGPPRAVVALGR